MHYLALIAIGTTLTLASGPLAAADGNPAQVLRLRITEHGGCEIAGESLSCGSVGSKLLLLCPSAKCQVLLDPDVRSKYETTAAVLKSLEVARFARVSFAAGTRPR